jgi:predicted nucleic acid-binding protein
MRRGPYLIDTNVISELRKAKPNPRVADWVASLTHAEAFLSVVTIGEIAKGIAKRRRLADQRMAADDLHAWLDGLLALYGNRIIAVDVPIAARWGRLCDVHPQLATDMLIAATALEHGLTVATRNTEHFIVANVPVHNPF